MAICFPGIASRVKRAATSDTRSAPFVITINCISTMIRKMIIPTTTFPPRMKSPKAAMTFPETPLLPRMFLVVETLIPRRNRVVISSSDGKIENSSGSRIVMVMTSIIIEREIFKMIATSTMDAGSGIIKRSMMVITNKTTE